MRNVFYFLAAMLSFGVAWYYYGEVTERTATVAKLRLAVEDGLVIAPGRAVDAEFIEEFIVSQPIPRALADEFAWALDDNPVTRINLIGRTFGQEVTSGSFLQGAHFFVPQQDDFARRIRPGNRALSIPVSGDRAVSNFIQPGARVDVLGTYKQGQDSYATRLILQNVEVMAVDGIDSRGEYAALDNRDYTSVTVQAAAAEVERFLADAEASSGDLTLVLRNPCEIASDCAIAEAGQ